jgi:hypothetical protein
VKNKYSLPETQLMKSNQPLFLLAFLFLSLISCSKELSKEHGYSPGPGNLGDFYATIDGKQWNADSLQLIQVDNSGIVAISGLSITGQVISMVVPVFKTGTYPLGGLALSYAEYGNLIVDPTKVYSSDGVNASGYITISSIDTVNHLMSGSFEFTLVDLSNNSTKTITKGIFNYVPYSGSYIPPPNGNILDTLNATVDGSPFISDTVITNVNNLGQLLIAGIPINTSKSIALLMPANVAPGTYNLDFTTGKYIGIYYPNSGSNPLVSLLNGSMTIISNNTLTKRIKGTFSFTATPAQGGGTPVKITNGYFSLNY